MNPRAWLAAIGKLLSPYVAKDTFRDGGDLVDTDGLTAGRDKVVHFVCGGILWFVMWGLAPLFALAGVDLGLRHRIILMLFFVTAWECFELARYLRWNSGGRRGPWPWACDQFSWRDIVAGLAGAFAFELPILLWTVVTR